MEPSNGETTLYHKFLGHFIRDNEGNLLSIAGSKSSKLEDTWPRISEHLLARPPGTRRYIIPMPDTDLTIFEHKINSKPTFQGICLVGETFGTFEHYLAEVVLSQTVLFTKAEADLKTIDNAREIAVSLADLFGNFLRHTLPTGDAWEETGRDVYLVQAEFAVSRDLPLEFVLPAFPCKSTNSNKVAGKAPDFGEELALRRLHDFVAAVESLYHPGAKVRIISDGHVFSDCIGVDDEAVDRYGAELTAMNERISIELGGSDRVGFQSLFDLLDIRNSHLESFTDMAISEVNHPLTTQLSHEAELCRKVLLAGCGPERRAVRAGIEGSDASALALYRGFSRFMLEDLENHPINKGMSKSQRKKLASKIAFEMIVRNQAYSNLVELLFPHHIRLSIHAHNNGGPKFGIQLFDTKCVRAIDSLETDLSTPPTIDLLHIPTPWHNCVVEVEGAPFLYVTKAKSVKNALHWRIVSGGWVEGDGQSGRFSARLCPPTSKAAPQAPLALGSSSPTPIEIPSGKSCLVLPSLTTRYPRVMLRRTIELAIDGDSTAIVVLSLLRQNAMLCARIAILEQALQKRTIAREAQAGVFGSLAADFPETVVLG